MLFLEIAALPINCCLVEVGCWDGALRVYHPHYGNGLEGNLRIAAGYTGDLQMRQSSGFRATERESR